MTTQAEHTAWAVKQLRALADEIEAGHWGSVALQIDNELEDRPRYSWEPFRGRQLVGRVARLLLHLPSKEIR